MKIASVVLSLADCILIGCRKYDGCPPFWNYRIFVFFLSCDHCHKQNEHLRIKFHRNWIISGWDVGEKNITIFKMEAIYPLDFSVCHFCHLICVCVHFASSLWIHVNRTMTLRYNRKSICSVASIRHIGFVKALPLFYVPNIVLNFQVDYVNTLVL